MCAMYNVLQRGLQHLWVQCFSLLHKSISVYDRVYLAECMYMHISMHMYLRKYNLCILASNYLLVHSHISVSRTLTAL